MGQSEQIQHHGDSQGRDKRGKHRPWVRWVVLIAVPGVNGLCGNCLGRRSQGSWFSILPILLFTVLGVVFSLLQWLFPISAGSHEQHMISSLAPHVSPTP